MLIIGAGRLGKHILEVLLDEGYSGNITFYDEAIPACDSFLNRYTTINSIEEARLFMARNGNDFITAIGHNRLREKMTQKFIKHGGKAISVVSHRAFVSPLLDKLPEHVFVQPGAAIAHSVCMGEGCVIHANSVIGHDVVMGKYVSVATLSTIIGPCEIGDYSFIGTNCVVMQGVKIGKNAIIGAGVTVAADVSDYAVITQRNS